MIGVAIGSIEAIAAIQIDKVRCGDVGCCLVDKLMGTPGVVQENAALFGGGSADRGAIFKDGVGTSEIAGPRSGAAVCIRGTGAAFNAEQVLVVDLGPGAARPVGEASVRP